MIDQILFEYIYDTFILTASVYYGVLPLGNQDTSYIVMTKIFDSERPETLCDTQGETGRADFQFSGFVGSLVSGGNPMQTMDMLETFKTQFADIRGVIGTPPNDYRIWNNETTSVRLIGDGESVEGVWGVLFRATLWWEKI